MDTLFLQCERSELKCDSWKIHSFYNIWAITSPFHIFFLKLNFEKVGWKITFISWIAVKISFIFVA